MQNGKKFIHIYSNIYIWISILLQNIVLINKKKFGFKFKYYFFFILVLIIINFSFFTSFNFTFQIGI